jgi:hypothetical protein
MNYFNSSVKEKTILDILSFDLSTFFYGDYKEVNSEDNEGTFLIDYEKSLPWSEFDLFDFLRFRVFNDKKNIHGSNHINAILINREESIEREKIVSMLDKIFQIYGKDDNGKGKWDATDEKEFATGVFLRTWTLGQESNLYTVQIRFTDDLGFCLSIILFTNLLRETNNI